MVVNEFLKDCRTGNFDCETLKRNLEKTGILKKQSIAKIELPELLDNDSFDNMRTKLYEFVDNMENYSMK